MCVLTKTKATNKTIKQLVTIISLIELYFKSIFLQYIYRVNVTLMRPNWMEWIIGNSDSGGHYWSISKSILLPMPLKSSASRIDFYQYNQN